MIIVTLGNEMGTFLVFPTPQVHNVLTKYYLYSVSIFTQHVTVFTLFTIATLFSLRAATR